MNDILTQGGRETYKKEEEEGNREIVQNNELKMADLLNSMILLIFPSGCFSVSQIIIK